MSPSRRLISFLATPSSDVRSIFPLNKDFGLPELPVDLLSCLALYGHEIPPKVERLMPKEYRKPSISAWSGLRGACQEDVSSYRK